MIMVAGYSLTDPSDRNRAVSAFGDMIEMARAQHGCVDFAISADPVDPSRLNLFELWLDEHSLNAWQAIASPPSVATTDVNVNCYQVEIARE